MTLSEYNNRKIPEYYPTMHLDGYTPYEIMAAKKAALYKEIQQQEAIEEIKITTEIKVK